MHATADQMVELGVLGRPHGVRGTLRVFLHNPQSSTLERVDSVLLKTGDGRDPTRHAIVQYQPGPKHGLLVLEGVKTREDAQALKGAAVLVPTDALPSPGRGEFYIKDLVGLEVVCDGGVLGKVVTSSDRGGVEVITVVDGDIEFEIPLVEEFVVDLDLRSGKLTVRDVDDLPRSKVRRKGPR